MCVVTYNRKFVTLDHLGEVDYGTAPFYIKHEGVYSFGGVLGKEASEQRPTNSTFFLPLGVSKNPRWVELET